VIAASNELDEATIKSLKEQGAAINVWGVGTRLVTAMDDPALGGIYKLSAIRDDRGQWRYRVKLSEQAGKTSTPGILQVLRFGGDEYLYDVIHDEHHPPGNGEAWMVDPVDPTRRKRIDSSLPNEPLLKPILRNGRLVAEFPPINQLRRRTHEQLSRFHAGIKRFLNPHQYPVGLEEWLYEEKTRLILQARGLQEVK